MKEIVLFQNEKEVKFGKVLCFILPTYLTSLFNTLYTIIDGIFLSNYAGPTALAAINIVYPLVNILYGIALVFATGGSSLMAIAMGSGENKEFRSRNSRAERGRISDIFLSRECASPGGFLFDRKWSNFLSNKKSLFHFKYMKQA